MKKILVFIFLIAGLAAKAQYPSFMPEFKVFNDTLAMVNHLAINGAVVLLRGIDSVDDGKGGWFQYNTLSTALEDGMNAFKVVGITTGRYLRMDLHDIDAFHTTEQISDTCFLILRPDGTEDTVCITGGVASGCANISVSINGGTAIYPDGACNINITDTAINWTNLFSAAFGQAAGLGAGVTGYVQITGRSSALNSPEVDVQFVLSENFTMSRMFVTTTTSQPVDASQVITLRKNGVDQALVVTIPAGSAAGTFSDLTHSVSVSAGDIINWKIVNNSSSTGAKILSIGATGIGQ